MHVEKLLKHFLLHHPSRSIHTHPQMSESYFKETTRRDWPVFSVGTGQA